MKISVVIPTYNRAKMLKRAIESVLAQSYQDYEIIVMDDGSTDNTTEIVKAFNDHRIRYVRFAYNSGGSMKPRTFGIGIALGIYIAILDDDSYWMDTDKLKLQVYFLDRHPAHLLVGTNAVAQTYKGITICKTNFPQDDYDIKYILPLKNCFFHSSMIYRRKEMMEAGGYNIIENGHFRGYSNDYELWLTLGSRGRMANLPIYGVGYTPTNNGIGFKNAMKIVALNKRLFNKYKSNYPHHLFAYFILFINAIATVANVLSYSNPIFHIKKYFKRGKLF